MKYQFPIYALAGVQPFMANKDVRRYLNGVMIEPLEKGRGVRLVATCGHALAVAYATEGASASEGAKRIILPDYAVKSIVRQSKPEKPVTLTIRDGGDFVAEVEPRPGMSAAVYGAVIDGRYPDAEAVVPLEVVDPSAADCCFDPALLGKLEAATKAVRRAGGCGRHAALHLEPNGDRAAPFRFLSLTSGFSLGGVLMPLRDPPARGSSLANLWRPA